MTLTTNGKNYIAQNFGIGDCFVASGLTWTAVAHGDSTVEESGGTQNIVARLVNTGVYKEIRLKTPRTGTFTYAELKNNNDGTDIFLHELSAAIGDHDGLPVGEDQYCMSVSTDPCPNQCIGADLWAYKRDADGACVLDYLITENSTACPGYTEPVGPQDPTAPMEFTFLPPCDGDPTVLIDISMLGMRQEGDTFYISGFKVKNTRECVAHFAMHLKIWDLALGAAVPTECPTATPEWAGVSRSTWDPEEPYIRTTTIEPYKTETINMNFFVPATILGRKTLCIYVWANFSKFALLDELETELGEVS